MVKWLGFNVFFSAWCLTHPMEGSMCGNGEEKGKMMRKGEMIGQKVCKGGVYFGDGTCSGHIFVHARTQRTCVILHLRWPTMLKIYFVFCLDQRF